MECEICGRQVSDNPKKAKIEGSVMIVCDECAKLGKIQKAPPKPKFRKSNKPKKNKTTKQNKIIKIVWGEMLKLEKPENLKTYQEKN